ncbi:MAG TPA: alginate lyase family protein [Dermatophilaceae bacterium]|nr:alginate lyase family protein [Dermatophilaceae bacterium]
MTPAVADLQAPPRPVACVIDHLGRDPHVATAARRGEFSHAGATLRLGRRPDWLAEHVADVEWRIEWVKLYEGLDLAHAFGVTGEPDYLRAWEDLVEAFLDQVPVDHDPADVTARRISNWVYAWQRFAAAPGFAGLRPGLGRRLRARILADAEHVRTHLTGERNHRTLELYALLVVALAFDAPREEAAAVLQLLTENAVTDVLPDGVHREASTDYHCIVLRSLLGAVANARASRLDVPGPLLERVRLACDFAMHVQRPDGLTPAVSDGDVGDFRHLLQLAADVLRRPDLAWVGSGGTYGRPPARRHVSFPLGGYHVQRSGWGQGARAYAEERFALFDAGPLGDGGHGHYDQLSVELYAAGQPLVVDPGRYTYDAAHGDWRRAFKGTAAHNTVTVDGRDQVPFRAGKPRGELSAARLLGRTTTDRLDVLQGQVVSPCYDAVHTRTVALVDDDYWVVHDRLRAPSPHVYQARWHLDPLAEGSARLAQGGGLVTAPGLALHTGGDGVAGLEPGWVSPAYGVRRPAPVATITTPARCDADLVTVVVPGGTGAHEVCVTVSEEVVEVTLRRGARSERVRWRTRDLAGRVRSQPC